MQETYTECNPYLRHGAGRSRRKDEINDLSTSPTYITETNYIKYHHVIMWGIYTQSGFQLQELASSRKFC
jgi:hypothetical protein